MQIYVAGAEAGPMKIGLAKEPGSRLRGIQTGHAARVKIHATFPVPVERSRDIELRAHWLLRHAHAHGEWFAVDAATATEAAREAVACNGEGEKARPTVGRKRINDEQTPARFPQGTLARIDALLAEKEKRSDFIRESVEREIARREKLGR
jgi:hypothetical protein